MNDEGSGRYLASPARREDGAWYCWKCEELGRECSPCRRAREQLERFSDLAKESKARRFTLRKLPLYLLGIVLLPLLLPVFTAWWSAAWVRRHFFLQRCRECGGVFVEPDRKQHRSRLTLAVRYGDGGEPDYWFGDPLIWKRHRNLARPGRQRT